MIGEIISKQLTIAPGVIIGGKKHEQGAPKPGPLYSLCVGLISIIATQLLRTSQPRTGAVCPLGFAESLVPLAQLVLTAADAAILVRVASPHEDKDEDDLSLWSALAKISLLSGITICIGSTTSWSSASEFDFSTHMSARDLTSFLYHGIAVSIAALSSIVLLRVLQPTTIALVFTSVAALRLAMYPWLVLPPISSGTLAVLGLSLGILLLAASHLAQRQYALTQSHTPAHLHMNLARVYVAFMVGGALWSLVSPMPAVVRMGDAVQHLVNAATISQKTWLEQSASSTTLAEAVSTYKQRYGIPPPPGFDKWYAFAVEHKSPIIDNFDQIYRDLLPFWGMEPELIRSKTKYLMSHQNLEMGSMRVRGGKLDQSPHIPGTHRWMSDRWEDMMRSFSQWLPDMDIALNLADECRMAVPFEAMQQFNDLGKKSQEALASAPTLKSSFSGHVDGRWPQQYPDLSGFPEDGVFENHFQKQIFGDFVSPTCPPNSPAKSRRWADWSSACLHCAQPHSVFTTEGPIVSNVLLSKDLCHQPDLAYLNGFLYSPSSMVGTRQLLPIFGQGRVGGFNDILIPSPWDFGDKSEYKEEHAVQWADKWNAMYWRGAPTDGFAANERWPGFLRPRFNNEAHQRTQALIARSQPNKDTPLAVNASFVGDPARCDREDCEKELATFSRWGVDVAIPGQPPSERGKLPGPLPFEEHWRYRHLFDMDGSGYSGRFLPFMRSHSLVYRAAVFRTWFDERIQAWEHYIPVDPRLGSGFWALLDYLSGGATAATKASAAKYDATGEKVAANVAEQGRHWARKALRKEDMQIYTFRLLLEWARVVDDDRGVLGFEMP